MQWLCDVLPSTHGHQVPTTFAGEGLPALTLPRWWITAWLLEAGGHPLVGGPTTFAYHISHSISVTAQDIKAIKTCMELNMSFGMALHIIQECITTMFHALCEPKSEINDSRTYQLSIRVDERVLRLPYDNFCSVASPQNHVRMHGQVPYICSRQCHKQRWCRVLPHGSELQWSPMPSLWQRERDDLCGVHEVAS